MKLFTRAKTIALDILFPPLCLGCKKTLSDNSLLLCANCLSKIHLENAFFCSECGNRFYEMKKVCHKEATLICGAAERYGNEPATELVKLLKYSGIQSAAEILGDIVFRYVASLKILLEDFIVIPMPLPKRRLRARGFNQAELIARQFLARAGYSENLHTDMVGRIFTKPQTEMKNYKAREKNIAGCFTIKNSDLIRGKSIIVIDDVYTSGATMHELARTLKAAGAKKILGLTVLRAIR